MRRMTLIAIALCLMMVATVGAGVVTAKQNTPPSHSVKQFDVTNNGEVVGKLIVNTNQWTYVLNAHGLTAGIEYWLAAGGKKDAIATATANNDGDVHMHGTWDRYHDAAYLQAHDPNEFFLVTGPRVFAATTYTVTVVSANPEDLQLIPAPGSADISVTIVQQSPSDMYLLLPSFYYIKNSGPYSGQLMHVSDEAVQVKALDTQNPLGPPVGISSIDFDDYMHMIVLYYNMGGGRTNIFESTSMLYVKPAV